MSKIKMEIPNTTKMLLINVKKKFKCIHDYERFIQGLNQTAHRIEKGRVMAMIFDNEEMDCELVDRHMSLKEYENTFIGVN